MGARGPAPQPTNIRIMNGNRGHRPLPEGEPTLPLVGELAPPEEMTKGARAVWERTLPLLVEMKVMTAADYDALVVYCYAVELHAMALRGCRRDGLVDRETGRTTPYLKIRKEAEETIKAFGDRFGLNPAFRSRIKAQAAPEKQKSKLAAFLGEG